jgi:hypothetical protein
MGCGSSRPEPEATPTGSSAHPPRPHISVPLPHPYTSAPHPGPYISATTPRQHVSAPSNVNSYQPRDRFTARNAPVRVDHPPPIRAPSNVDPFLHISSPSKVDGPHIARSAPKHTGKFNNRARPREHSSIRRKPPVSPLPLQSNRPRNNPGFRYSCKISPVDESFDKLHYNPNSNFEDVSPVDENSPK